jgi:Sep-tRNA:Cys-tRNA synthetase
MGCTLMGATLLTMIASFPHVRARTEHWDEVVRKSSYFLEQFQRVSGSRVLSEWPRKHTLSKVDTTANFDVMAKTQKRRGFFFSDELKARGIAGEFAGATRTWKLNTYEDAIIWPPMDRMGWTHCRRATAHSSMTSVRYSSRVSH